MNFDNKYNIIYIIYSYIFYNLNNKNKLLNKNYKYNK